MTGEWPEADIDHKNGNKADNRFVNLRAVTRTVNSHNRCKRNDNKSGYKGVSWHKRTSKWVAQIQNAGTRKHLGLFDTPEDAYNVYCAAAKQIGYTSRHIYS